MNDPSGIIEILKTLSEALRMGLSMNHILDLETLRFFVLLLIDTIRFALPLFRSWAIDGRRKKKGGARRKA